MYNRIVVVSLRMYFIVVVHAATAHSEPPQQPPACEHPTERHAWTTGEEDYRPPDFDAYFPDSPEGARELATWWASRERVVIKHQDALALIRQGLRRYEGDPRPLLQWLGNTLIYRKSPQDPTAIEVMYHAAAIRGPNEAPHETQSAAVYFGLSVVRPMTDAILQTLVDVCIQTDDPDILSRITWGVADRRPTALTFLQPYRESNDLSIRDKAVIVDKILNREIQATTWASEHRRKSIEATYGNELMTMADTLRDGTSAQRLTTLNLIDSKHLTLIMNDGHLNDFKVCAQDSQAEVRKQVAKLVGTRWIWEAPTQNPRAIALMMELSQDPDRAVRFNAVYYGLSTIAEKEDDIIRQLLSIACLDNQPDVLKRITWGLRGQKEQVRRHLKWYIEHGGPEMAHGALLIYDVLVDG